MSDLVKITFKNKELKYQIKVPFSVAVNIIGYTEIEHAKKIIRPDKRFRFKKDKKK